MQGIHQISPSLGPVLYIIYPYPMPRGNVSGDNELACHENTGKASRQEEALGPLGTSGKHRGPIGFPPACLIE